MSEIHLLYIDDDAATHELVRTALGTAGMRVYPTWSGEEGLEAMQNAAFDLVIADYRLPGISGLEVVRTIVKHQEPVPVIMLSGSTDLDVVVEAMKLGASDYLIKDGQNAYLELLPVVVHRHVDNQHLLHERNAVEAMLEAERNWSRIAISNIQQGVSVFDADLRLRLCNPQFLAICGYPRELGEYGTCLEVFMRFNAMRGDYGKSAGESDIRRRIDRARQPGSFHYERQVGETTVEISRKSLPAGGFVVTYMDVSERRRAEERIRYQAYHDVLTGLPNRVLFQELLDHEMAGAKRADTSFALLFVDLDGFKPINDRLGHLAGDALLIAVAQRLKQNVRESDVVARQGGDEFLILLIDATMEQGAEVAEILVNALSAAFALKEGSVQVSASIGIAAFPQSGRTDDALLRAADDAMYRAKAAGKGGYRLAISP